MPRTDQIAATMGRQLPPGGVSVNDVVSMTKCGVNEDLIVNHIRANGVARPLAANELISLQQEGVSTRVIATMQSATVPVARPVVGGPAPVMVNPYYSSPSASSAAILGWVRVLSVLAGSAESPPDRRQAASRPPPEDEAGGPMPFGLSRLS